MAIGRTQMKTQLQGNRKMKKYQAGMGVMTSTPQNAPKRYGKNGRYEEDAP